MSVRVQRAVRMTIGEGMCKKCLTVTQNADNMGLDAADCLACRAHLEVRDGGWEFVSRNPKAEAV